MTLWEARKKSRKLAYSVCTKITVRLSAHQVLGIAHWQTFVGKGMSFTIYELNFTGDLPVVGGEPKLLTLFTTLRDLPTRIQIHRNTMRNWRQFKEKVSTNINWLMNILSR